MVTTQPASKRPICPSCSKPVRLCLCTRIQNPGLHNSVSVTILQHSLEKNHPLNSARIARLGLKNLSVVTVYDVNFESRFVIRSPGPVSQMGSDRNGLKSSGFDQLVESSETQKLDFVYCDEVSERRERKCGNVDGQCNVDEGSATTALPAASRVSDVVHGSGESVEMDNGAPVIPATIGKHGVISSLSHIWMPQTREDKKFDMILHIADARNALAEGFIVQKLQKPLKGSVELDECVEFEVEVLPGSVLLFPSEEAVSADDLEAMNVKVNNLVVLDGTWARAKRMYGENPCLKLLLHLKLNLDKMSLYSEVRLQPKPGFLSTIDSIVYALKAVGDNPEGLDNLLDVFESMIEDHIRCKVERLSNALPGPA